MRSCVGAAEHGDQPVADERADHVDVAVREVQQLQDPVDHRVAERDQRVDAAVRDPGDQLGDEEVPVHPRGAHTGRRGRSAPRPPCDVLLRRVTYLPFSILKMWNFAPGDVAVRGERERRRRGCVLLRLTFASSARTLSRVGRSRPCTTFEIAVAYAWAST